MKKLIALLLCVVLLLACAVSASAAGTTAVEIIADKAEAKPGDKITFEVRIDGSEECTSFGIALEYDTAALEIVDGKCSLDNATLSVFDKEKGFAYLFEGGIVPEGTVGTFTMKVKDGAANGTVGVSAQLAVKKGSDTIPSEVKPANITVKGSTNAQKPEKPDASSGDTQQEVSSQTQTEDQQTQQTQQTDRSPETVTEAEPQQQTEDTLQNLLVEAPQQQEQLTETLPQEQPVEDPQSVTAPVSSPRVSLEMELLIAAAVLVLLVAALVVCLVILGKRKKGKR